jgi:parallel beta-helix repeat protein
MHKYQLTSVFLVTITVGILFASSSVQGDTPAFPEPTPVYTVIIEEGDLELHGDQTMIIEDTNLTIKNGTIKLYDNSHLVIRNSIIQTREQPDSITVTSSALLEAYTSIFGSFPEGINPAEAEQFEGQQMEISGDADLIMDNCFIMVLGFHGESNGIVKNSFIGHEPLGLLHVENEVDVVVEDSVLGAVFLALGDAGFPLHIDNLHPGYLEYWSLKDNISPNLTYNLTLERTEILDNVNGWDGGFELGWNIAIGSEDYLTITNSVLNKLVIAFSPGENIHFSGLQTRTPVNFNHRNIYLWNTIVQTQWGMDIKNNDAIFEDSWGIWLLLSGNKDVYLRNTQINEIDPSIEVISPPYTGTIHMENAIWRGGYEIWSGTNMRMVGSVRTRNEPIFFENARMARSYEIFLLDDATQDPMNGVSLALKKDGVSVWTGTTNHNGMIDFDILFTHENYQDFWILESLDPQIDLQWNISVKASNPIKISLQSVDNGIYRPIYHVATDGHGFPFGTKKHPYASIEEAIYNSGGGVILVAPGKYTADTQPGQVRGNIELKDDAVLLGRGPDKSVIAGGIAAEDVSGAQVSGFTIEDGMWFISSYLSLTNNIVTGQDEHGLVGSDSILNIINNIFSQNGGSGIALTGESSAIVKNNIFYNNARFAVEGMGPSTAVIDYNNATGNVENYVGDNLILGAGNISTDPLFKSVNGGNYHLRKGSPCIDAGDLSGEFDDPDGTRNDIGAFGGPQANQRTRDH